MHAYKLANPSYVWFLMLFLILVIINGTFGMQTFERTVVNSAFKLANPSYI